MDDKYPFNISAGLEYIRSHPYGPEPANKNGSLGVTSMEYTMAKLLLDVKSKTLQKYTPYITALTVLLLATSVMRRMLSKSTWRVQDLMVSGLCLGLLWTADILPVLLASNIALSYLTWILLPASSPIKNLPSYEHFMLNLKTVTPPPQSQDDNDEKVDHDRCIICWEEETDVTLAILPCTHHACTTCLSHLEDQNKSTCPFCSRLLWRKGHQTLNIRLQKLRMACYATTILLYLLNTIYWARYGEYSKAFWQLPILVISTIMPLTAKVLEVRRGERDWWVGSQVMGVSWEWAPAVFMVVMKAWAIRNVKLSDIGDEFTITFTPAANATSTGT